MATIWKYHPTAGLAEWDTETCLFVVDRDGKPVKADPKQVSFSVAPRSTK